MVFSMDRAVIGPVFRVSVVQAAVTARTRQRVEWSGCRYCPVVHGGRRLINSEVEYVGAD